MLRGRAERDSVVRTCSSLRPQRNWGWLHLLGTCLPPLPRTNRAHASSLTMDHGFLPRSMWTSDSKVPHQTTDVFTSVVVTRNIPYGTSFGPCVLQHTFYDTIAFIAQKSCDKKTKPYVFRVDPDGMRNSALVLSWLRLVQAARNSEEQNLEAYLKAGQLYVRTTRNIKQEEELLVWYDQELSYLLGFGDMAMKMSTDDLKCLKCNQGFKNEYPFLAHCRFLCDQAKSDASSREAYERKHMEIKRQHRVTDFHNIARDLEHKRPTGEDAEVSFKKRKYEEGVYPKGRKSVLLEKTNISNDSNITQLTRDYEQTALDSSASISKLRSEKYPDNFIESKNSAFTEVGETKGTFTHDGESTIGERPAVSSAFSLMLANSQAEQKSAFCKPRKRTPNSDFTAHIATAPTTSSHHQDDVADVFTSKTRHIGYSNLISSNLLDTLQAAQSVPAQVTMGGAFHFAPDHWSRSIGGPLQTTSSPTILPPTFTSFGVSVQNWCAKCNLSFRMTSDLVFHMRSHHKKEFALESHVRRRREEKLTCPICHEYFRERHHLSRHMTSHN